MVVPDESNIMAQANYVKDKDGVTYYELPDVASQQCQICMGRQQTLHGVGQLR